MLIPLAVVQGKAGPPVARSITVSGRPAQRTVQRNNCLKISSQRSIALSVMAGVSTVAVTPGLVGLTKGARHPNAGWQVVRLPENLLTFLGGHELDEQQPRVGMPRTFGQAH